MDNDVVDITNLNRQILFNKDDVGRRKVDAAKDGLKHHLLDTGKNLSCLYSWQCMQTPVLADTLIEQSDYIIIPKNQPFYHQIYIYFNRNFTACYCR